MKIKIEFDKFYQVLINLAKEDKVNERDFYALIKAKCKVMEREHREKLDNNKNARIKRFRSAKK